MANKSVKICPYCGKEIEIAAVCGNPECEPFGLQLDYELSLSFYYFNHNVAHCGTTFVIPAEWFDDLLEIDPDLKLLAGSSVCEKHCLDVHDHRICSQNCRNAPHRIFMERLREKYLQACELGEKPEQP